MSPSEKCSTRWAHVSSVIKVSARLSAANLQVIIKSHKCLKMNKTELLFERMAKSKFANNF